MYASFPGQRHVSLLPVLSFCWITPVFWISPQSLPPQDPPLQLLYLLSLSMRLCSWLKANSVRGLNSILLFQNSYYQSCNFFPVFIFQTRYACPLSQWLSALTEVVHLVGPFIMERSHAVSTDCLWPSCAGDLQESWSLGYLSCSTVRSIWHISLRVCCRV